MINSVGLQKLNFTSVCRERFPIYDSIVVTIDADVIFINTDEFRSLIAIINIHMY